MDLLQQDAKYLNEYEKRFGHSAPASLLRSRLLGVGFLAKEWLDKNVPNPQWAEAAKFAQMEEGKEAQF